MLLKATKCVEMHEILTLGHSLAKTFVTGGYSKAFKHILWPVNDLQQIFLLSYNKDSNFRCRSAGRAGRAMGNGSFERSWTPHERFMLAFLIFALPALPGAKIALPPLSEVTQRGVEGEFTFFKMASKRPNGRTLVRF